MAGKDSLEGGSQAAHSSTVNEATSVCPDDDGGAGEATRFLTSMEGTIASLLSPGVLVSCACMKSRKLGIKINRLMYSFNKVNEMMNANWAEVKFLVSDGDHMTMSFSAADQKKIDIMGCCFRKPVDCPKVRDGMNRCTVASNHQPLQQQEGRVVLAKAGTG